MTVSPYARGAVSPREIEMWARLFTYGAVPPRELEMWTKLVGDTEDARGRHFVRPFGEAPGPDADEREWREFLRELMEEGSHEYNFFVEQYNELFDADADFEEEEHPRGFGGRWVTKGAKTAKASSSGEGKGSEVEVASPEDQRAASKEIENFLGFVANVHGDRPSPQGFQVEHGRAFQFDEKSFVGGGRRHECYKNAAQLAISSPKYTYVEGYVSVHGVPIEHAWVVGKDDRVVDPTIGDPKGIRAYRGVPVDTDYLTSALLRTKVYGVLGHTNWPHFFEHATEVLAKRKKVKDDWDESKHPRGKTSAGSTPGSFAPAETGTWASVDFAATKLFVENTASDKRTLDEVIEQDLSLEEKIFLAEGRAAVVGVVPSAASVEKGGFTLPNGTYTPERQAIHAEIVRSLLSPEAVARATPEAGKRPVYAMTGGRPGAGKSSSIAKVGLDPSKYIVISADNIQELLPGYREAGLAAAGKFNAEAQDIAVLVERVARTLKLNILYDATMKTAKGAVDRVVLYRASGYDVKAYFVHTTPATSAKRVVSRATVTGRFLPPEVPFNSKTNEQTFDALRQLGLDEWFLFDNNGKAPRLVASGGR